MTIQYVKAKNKQDAYNKCAFSPAAIEKVVGGYACFEFMTDLHVWNNSGDKRKVTKRKVKK